MANIRPLSKELQAKAAEELNENVNRISEDLQHIKDWLQMQVHIKARTDDQWLIAFLRGCKYSLEKTKTKLDLYYSFRSFAPYNYKNRYPFSPEITEILEMTSLSFLPQNTSSADPTVVLMRWDVCSSQICTLRDVLKFWSMSIDIILMEDDSMVVSGIIGVSDMAQLTLNYTLQFTPPLLKEMVFGLEKALPLRVKAIHVINAPQIFETVFNMAKRLMSKKLQERVHIYSSANMDEFYKKVPKSVMPKEYGGDNASVYQLAAERNKKIASYGEWFLEDEQYCSNEALRPSNLPSPGDLLGMEGSFRKLNVD